MTLRLVLLGALTTLLVACASFDSKTAAVVSGKVCYPSDRTPPMTIYARNLATRQTFSIHVEMDAQRYRLRIPVEGEYVFFAWTDSDVQGFRRSGATYSPAVPCGLKVSCEDHQPIAVKIRRGKTYDNIDVCDYYTPHDRIDELVPKP